MAFVPTVKQTHMWLASSGSELQVKVPRRQLALQLFAQLERHG